MVEDEDDAPAQKPVGPAGPIKVDNRIAARQVETLLRQFLASKIRSEDEAWFRVMCLRLADQLGDYYTQSQRLAHGNAAGNA
ncbi:hypothetical protein ASF24_09660 [Methylobacterium sp. Leaf86]|nr:hypothetical protein ASF24_09660 [Methylobacterium sp. Leaf86]